VTPAGRPRLIRRKRRESLHIDNSLRPKMRWRRAIPVGTVPASANPLTSPSGEELLMNDQSADKTTPAEQVEDRRSFLAKAGKIAIVAPAGALLLASTTKSQAIQAGSGPA
jgi:hypothetical protein